jgi:hypothetical protein
MKNKLDRFIEVLDITVIILCTLMIFLIAESAW